MTLKEQRQWVLNELNSVADFWLKNGMDKVHLVPIVFVL